MSQTHEEPTADSTEPVNPELSEAGGESVDAPVPPGDLAGAAHVGDQDNDVEDHSDLGHDDADVADSPAAGLDAEVEPSEVFHDDADDTSGLAADDTSGLAADEGSDDDAVDLASDEQDDVDGVEPAGSSRRSRRAPSRDLLEKEGEIAADFLETLLDICDLDGDLDVDIDGDRAAVSIVDSDEGRVPRRLVGSDGKVLDALQELTRLAVYSSTGERSRLILDIAGHCAERRTTLVAQAQAAIAAVRETGQKQALDPMSAFERKIVHDEVLAGGLHSESDGVEPRRYVVVLPA